ncbi:O-Antigen ligase [Rubripirellula tenax]|uniref:O-Antigen ligase n=2 Tax=Rubripirellula tenax TaxID=2528015 RepID=A0A5C6FJA4_9BACT|nr:O-Antigen ligase [Rubripirellula tenax]
MMWVARAIVIGALAYGTWLNGATDASTLYRIAIALSTATLLTVVASMGQPSVRMPRIFFALWVVWIVYAAAQTAPVNSVTRYFFRGPASIQDEFVEPGLADLSIDVSGEGADEVVGEVPDESVSSRFQYIPRGTVSLDETRRAITPYLVGFGFALLASRLFTTSASRRVLLWCIAINCTLLAAWGILQRAGGSSDLLPGLSSPYSSPAFSSFIYKNAGAAAILPGAAAAILLVLINRSSIRSRAGYRGSHPMLTRRNITLMLALAVMVIGLTVSLSRGACVSAFIAFVVVALIRRRGYGRVAKYSTIFFAVMVIGVFASSFVTERLTESMQRRLGDVSLDALSTDQRWKHWQDGFTTAVSNFPSGTGLGTYGYATLPYQEETFPYWFREAHNQYLEIFTEMGAIGIVILVAMIVWFLRLCRSGFRDQANGSTVEWASFGIALALMAGIQSVVDFVIAIPANLFVYAVFISTVATRLSLTVDPASKVSLKKTEPRNVTAIVRPILMGVVALASLAPAISLSQQRAIADKALDETILSSANDSQTIEFANEMLSRLDKAIVAAPRNASLWERRAWWHLIAYRVGLMEELQNRGENVVWTSTDPININEFITLTPAENRDATRNVFRSTDSLRQSLEQMQLSASEAIRLNALQTSSYYRSMLVAEFTGLDRSFWKDKSARLSNNDARRLFVNGLMAYLSSDDEQMIDQWNRSLSIDDRNWKPIMQIATTRMTPLRVAERLVPSRSPNLILDLAVANVPDRQTDPKTILPTEFFDPKVARGLIEYCETDSRFDNRLRFQTLAQLHEKLDDFAAAGKYWDMALTEAPENPGYRIRLIEALMKQQKFAEALDQAIVGRSLHPNEKRFRSLVAQSRSGLANQH